MVSKNGLAFVTPLMVMVGRFVVETTVPRSGAGDAFFRAGAGDALPFPFSLTLRFSLALPFPLGLSFAGEALREGVWAIFSRDDLRSADALRFPGDVEGLRRCSLLSATPRSAPCNLARAMPRDSARLSSSSESSPDGFSGLMSGSFDAFLYANASIARRISPYSSFARNLARKACLRLSGRLTGLILLDLGAERDCSLTRPLDLLGLTLLDRTVLFCWPLEELLGALAFRLLTTSAWVIMLSVRARASGTAFSLPLGLSLAFFARLFERPLLETTSDT